MEGTSLATGLRFFETQAGAEIFQIALPLFPGLWGYSYLVFVDDDGKEPLRVLIDAGSGIGDANEHLQAVLQAVSQHRGEPVGLEHLTHILITHGHIDHIGGLAYVRPRTQALLGVHELDLRNLTSYEERVTVIARRLGDFLIESGVSAGLREDLLLMYKSLKGFFHSVKVDFTFEACGMRLGPFRFLHVPGHCPGHVVIRLHDVLFSGDHVLSDISPHQSPEQLTHSTGLEHYLESLDALRSWAAGVSLALGGHNDPIPNLSGRLDAIQQLHSQRLQQVLEILDEPHTIAEVSRALFGEVHGYNVLLALEEAGAHVEYLYQRGLLGIENLGEMENSGAPVPIRYRCLPCRDD